jgi:hypothetical protein
VEAYFYEFKKAPYEKAHLRCILELTSQFDFRSKSTRENHMPAYTEIHDGLMWKTVFINKVHEVYLPSIVVTCQFNGWRQRIDWHCHERDP